MTETNFRYEAIIDFLPQWCQDMEKATFDGTWSFQLAA